MATVWSCRTWRWLAKEDDVKSHSRETQQNLQEKKKETRVALFSSFHLLAVSHRHDNLSTNVWQLYIYRASVSTSLTQLLIVESSRWRKCSFNWHIEILARRSDTCWFITTMRWKKNWRKKRCRWVASSWLYLLSCIATASFVVETNCCSPPLLLFLQQQRAVHSNVTRQLVFFFSFPPWKCSAHHRRHNQKNAMANAFFKSHFGNGGELNRRYNNSSRMCWHKLGSHWGTQKSWPKVRRNKESYDISPKEPIQFILEGILQSECR